MFVVCVLYSEKFNKHYTGYTLNLKSRISSHNELATKGFTLKYRPWKIIYTKEFITKSEAIQYEKFLKTGSGREFIKTLPH